MDAILGALPLLFLLSLIYLFGILPRQRRMAKQAALVSGLRVNDAVTTSGGVRGRVVGWKGALIMVEVAPGVTFDIEPAKIEAVSDGTAAGQTARCPNCGAAAGPEDQFCGDCGAPSRRE
jgi:preprotein translocase YajC subunit